MTTAAGLPPLPRRLLPSIWRSQVRGAVEQYTATPGVRAVGLALSAGVVTRLVIHWEAGHRTTLNVKDDA